MRLFLIRHGETVDNVASLFAGSRDSALTNHGVLQCRRLAQHLARDLGSSSAAGSFNADGGARVHIFSSNLQRAAKTAEMVHDALGGSARPPVQQLVELREKDFGSGEGQSFATATRGEGRHVGAETTEAMRVRADAFLDEHLLPLVVPGSSAAVVVVAHGIILTVLFNRLCEHITRAFITVAPDAQRRSDSFSKGDLPVLPSWSNTGYLEASLTVTEPRGWASVKLHIHRINVTDHLRGLRKTRGGIGSARFDEKQKTMESFFTKKRKLADAAD